jgi:hypothetical protein
MTATVAHPVPAVLCVDALAPGGDVRCGVCGDRYGAHSGRVCSICRRPVEHHTAADVAAEVSGALRMERARAAHLRARMARTEDRIVVLEALAGEDGAA